MDGSSGYSSGNSCIGREELLQSFVNGLTEPAAGGGNRSEARNGDNKDRTSLPSNVHRVIFQKFKSYFQHLSLLVLSCLVAVLACSLRGDVLFFTSLTYKTYIAAIIPAPPACSSSLNTSTVNPNNLTNSATSPPHQAILPEYLQLPESHNLPDLLLYVAASILFSELTYHLLCGFIQVYFYVLQRDRPEEWKCQPHRFLTRSNEIHEIVVGTSNMFFAGGLSGFLTCWILSGGHHTTMYFSAGEHGYLYLVLSSVLLFLWLEASAYYIHMMMHKPFLYKTIHKHHHRYHSPTAYSAVAMSPIELFSLDAAIILPIFVVPIYSLVYMAELIYVYYFGLMDHSGVKMDSLFPWQPSTTFHDNHHRYFHCNYGFNTYLFDWLHSTLRRTDRVYGEHIFNPNKKK